MRTSSSRHGRGRRTAVNAVAAIAVMATGAALLTGCGSDGDNGKAKGDGAAGGGSGEQITLRIGTFGSFGYDDATGAKLYAEYTKAHPNIKIEESNVADGQKYWDTLKLRL
ncbi:carbohydrate ABC transporter substrate-binding protein, partial [Streptomyces sp. NPDC006487]